KYNISELLSLECEKTFSPRFLAKWILQLRELNTTCPCKSFNFQISQFQFNCPIYSKSYFCEPCSQNCKNCDLSCDLCERNDYWFNINKCIKTLESFRGSSLWNILVCLFLAKELKTILKDRSIELKNYYPEEFSCKEVTNVLNIK
ncbi:MAG: hypothetical protein ACFFG0_11110, partial [Candidatus Thorarchaeota archaeon]